MSKRPRRTPLLFYLLVALALHLIGAALALLWSSPAGPEEHASTPALHELDLVARPRQAARQPHPPRPAESRPPPEPARPQPPQARRPSRPRARQSSEEGGSLSPTLSLTMRRPDLTPSPDLFIDERPRDPAGRTLRSEPRPDRRAEASRVKNRIQAWLHRDAGQRNATHGRVHPALVAVLQRARSLYSPSESTVPKRLRHAGKELITAYRAGIQAFNSMGRALPFDYQDFGQTVTPPMLLEGNAAIAKGVVEDGSQHRFTEICIRAAPARRPELRKVRSSGIRALDRQARRAMEGALAQVMPADLPSTTACYRFGLAWGRMLPTPSLDFLCGQLLRPGGGTLRYGVTLVAAWPASPAATSALGGPLSPGGASGR